MITGDESLPWRQNRVKPWTEESVQLKRTVKQKIQVEKEKIEAFELKPSKIQKSQIEKSELEKVDLRTRVKGIESVVESTEEVITEEETETERRKRVFREKYQEVEDSNLLELERREKIEESRIHKELLKNTEDSSELKLKNQEEETVVKKYVPWRKTKEQGTEEPIIEVEEAKPAEEIPIWRRGKKDNTQIVQEPSKPEEKPWNEQIGQLKKTQRHIKPFDKEKIESVELKPSRIETKDIPKSTLEQVILNRQLTQIQDVVLEKSETQEKHFLKPQNDDETSCCKTFKAEEDLNLLSISQNEELNTQKAVPWRRGKVGAKNVMVPETEKVHSEIEDPSLSEEPQMPLRRGKFKNLEKRHSKSF